MLVCFDMDEVLTDFIGAAAKLHEITREELEEVRVPGEWSIEKPIGTIKNDPTFDTNDFWNPIHEAGEDFWYYLNKLPWFDDVKRLMEDCHLAGGDFRIVTSPSKHPSSYSGKVRWLKTKFGMGFDKFHITPHKEDLATYTSTVLIDDREENIYKFTKAGGQGILFPSLGNSLYEYANNPVPYVRHQLKELSCI